jgi:hypothetical protein
MAIISFMIQGPAVFVPWKPFQPCPMFAFKLVANPIKGKCTSLLALGAIIILSWNFSRGQNILAYLAPSSVSRKNVFQH